MKRALMVLAVLSLLVPTLAAAESWSGWITDDHCGAKGAKAEHVDCAKKCLDNGGKLVFYNPADEKVYNLANAEGAVDHLGHEVVVTGTVDGDTITVESIAKAGE